MEKEKLTPEETETLIRLLQKVTPLPKMEWPILEAFWKNRLMPMNPMELIILERVPDDILAEGYPRVLLRYKPPYDPYFPDCWHHPGGYLGANETIYDAIQRIAAKEIGVGVKNLISLPPANFPNLLRDHEFSGLHICEPMAPSPLCQEKIRWFDFFDLPRRMPTHHIYMHFYVQRWLDILSRLYRVDHSLAISIRHLFVVTQTLFSQ